MHRISNEAKWRNKNRINQHIFGILIPKNVEWSDDTIFKPLPYQPRDSSFFVKNRYKIFGMVVKAPKKFDFMYFCIRNTVGLDLRLKR